MFTARWFSRCLARGCDLFVISHQTNICESCSFVKCKNGLSQRQYCLASAALRAPRAVPAKETFMCLRSSVLCFTFNFVLYFSIVPPVHSRRRAAALCHFVFICSCLWHRSGRHGLLCAAACRSPLLLSLAYMNDMGPASMFWGTIQETAKLGLRTERAFSFCIPTHLDAQRIRGVV